MLFRSIGRILRVATCLLATSALAQGAFAQYYPAKPVRIVVPFPPGGPVDFAARTVGSRLAAEFGQPVVIDNRPGASSVIGTEYVVKSPADGYTLMVGGPSLALTRFLYAKVPYDVDRDIAPVILVAKIPNVLLVHPSVPAKTLKEFVQLARANPDIIGLVAS